MKAKGPNFSVTRDNMIDILAIDKPPYKRSNKPLRRIPIADVIGPKDMKSCENPNLKISDEDIDKLFNSNCGPFVEVKHSNNIAHSKSANANKTVSDVKTEANARVGNSRAENNQNTSKSVEVGESSLKAGTDVLLLNGNVSAIFSFFSAIIAIITKFLDVIKESSQNLFRRNKQQTKS